MCKKNLKKKTNSIGTHRQHKEFQPNWFSRLAGYWWHIYECLVLLYRLESIHKLHTLEFHQPKLDYLLSVSDVKRQFMSDLFFSKEVQLMFTHSTWFTACIMVGNILIKLRNVSVRDREKLESTETYDLWYFSEQVLLCTSIVHDQSADICILGYLRILWKLSTRSSKID